MNKTRCELLWAIYEEECGGVKDMIWAGAIGLNTPGVRMDVEWRRDQPLTEPLSHNVGLQGNLFTEQDWKDL